ncbi:MAG TPA: DUF1330 domain-containing protein [Stellaceae bacterium]|nr:DUF1330 domain-containing protein [Stellaceae bacterium]
MPDKRPAYVIAEIEITDPAGFQDYVAKAIPTLAGYNARLMTRSKAHSKEGTAPVGEIVIVAFDSLDEAERWYGSAAYGKAIPMRQRSANTRLFIVEGEPQ